MFERMLNKSKMPDVYELSDYCGEFREDFKAFNAYVSSLFETQQSIAFPYGNKYGWCISHKVKKKLICNVFAEQNAFTVMLRLTGKQFDSLSGKASVYAQNILDNKYPCGDGGWIHFPVREAAHIEDIKLIIAAKKE